MISIPTWLFIVWCIYTGFTLLMVLGVILDIISQCIYEKHEFDKYKNKEKEKQDESNNDEH